MALLIFFLLALHTWGICSMTHFNRTIVLFKFRKVILGNIWYMFNNSHFPSFNNCTQNNVLMIVQGLLKLSVFRHITGIVNIRKHIRSFFRFMKERSIILFVSPLLERIYIYLCAFSYRNIIISSVQNAQNIWQT